MCGREFARAINTKRSAEIGLAAVAILFLRVASFLRGSYRNFTGATDVSVARIGARFTYFSLVLYFFFC